MSFASYLMSRGLTPRQLRPPATRLALRGGPLLLLAVLVFCSLWALDTPSAQAQPIAPPP